MAQLKKYNRKWPPNVSALDIELFCLRHDPRGDWEDGRLDSFSHYKNAVDIIFNNKDSTRHHIWNEWGELMVREALSDREPKRFLGVAGASSGGKSDCFGLYAIIMYLSAPTETLCLLTSTTIEMAKGRIWKAVKEYWSQVEYYFDQKGAISPGKSVHSKCVIRGLDAQGEITDASGLRLVAADKQKGEEATSKVMGAKAPSNTALSDDPDVVARKIAGALAPGGGLCLLIADELPDLSANLLTVAYTNLINNPKFQMIALGNPNLKLDPFGKFCEPTDGWTSVAHEPSSWLTPRGKVIRLDAEISPRIKEEQNWDAKDRAKKSPKCFWMPSQAVMDAAKETYTATSRYYYRMYKAMWCSDKAPNAIYSESELMKASGTDEPEWDNPEQLTRICGLDSAFTSGGDRSPSIEALCGRVKGAWHLHIVCINEIPIDDTRDMAPSHQIVINWRNMSVDRGISPQCAGFDNSGAGIAFGHIVDMEWSPKVKKIEFGGSPSGRVISLNGDTKLEFANRVSELWVQPKPYIRQSQISGLPSSVMEELVAREYDENQSGHKLKIEAKKKMRTRTGKSPDLADSFVVLVDVAIQNRLLDSQEQKAILTRAQSEFRGKRKRFGMSSTGRKSKKLKF